MRKIATRMMKIEDLQESAFKELYSNKNPAGPAFTGYDEETGKIVFCCGVVDIFKHSGEAWVQLHDKSYVAAFREVKEILHFLLGYYTRIQSVIDKQIPENIRFVEHLGFEKEGELRAYGPEGQDMIMYSIIGAER